MKIARTCHMLNMLKSEEKYLISMKVFHQILKFYQHLIKILYQYKLSILYSFKSIFNFPTTILFSCLKPHQQLQKYRKILMKRKFDEISTTIGASAADGDETHSAVFGNEAKRRRLEEQKQGEFIVDAVKAVNFKLTSNMASLEDERYTSKYFAPIYMGLLFGEKECISGYEGLSVDITLSKKRLYPHFSMQYDQKAPAFANIDNVEDKFQKHFGRIYKGVDDFIALLKEEESFQAPGAHVEQVQLSNGKQAEIQLVSLEDESFHEQNFYLQAILPFFIDGASTIEPCPFWKYFMVYDSETKDLLAFATVYHAHLTADRFRARISQVLVLPPYQRQGLGQALYQSILAYYRTKQAQCFQVVVEDAADDFQKVQDIVNTRAYLEENAALRTLLGSQPIANIILSEEIVHQCQLSKSQVTSFSKALKLPEMIILRLNDIVLYSAVDPKAKAGGVARQFALSVKRRYYLVQIREYMTLFKDIEDNILALTSNSGLAKPYVYNGATEDGDPYTVVPGEEQGGQSVTQDQIMAKEGMKMQLKQIYTEIVKQYAALKPKVNRLLNGMAKE